MHPTAHLHHATLASCGWGGQEIRILEESRGLMMKLEQWFSLELSHKHYRLQSKGYKDESD